jgi:hypothetical protein
VQKTIPQLLGFALLILVISTAVPAQNITTIAANPPTNSGGRAVLSQTALTSLSTLPEADTLFYINIQRILNEAAPRLVPEKELARMREGFSQMKQFAGVDPAKIEYIVIAVRFRKPSAELNFIPPEFMAVASGDLSAESLIGLARMAAEGKLRDEKYGNKTLGLMTIDPIAREAEKNPFLKAFSEVAIVPLSANTIAVGTPAYLRAAVDAAEGKERINAETLNSLVRDTSALISMSGRPWHSFAKSFGMLGTEANAREARCESKIGDFYAALTMDATNFMLRGAMNADNPDTAKIINNLFSGLLKQAVSSVPDKNAQSALKALSLTPENDEVVLRADIPQQMVLDLIKEQLAAKKQEASAPATSKQPVRKPTGRKRRGTKH